MIEMVLSAVTEFGEAMLSHNKQEGQDLVFGRRVRIENFEKNLKSHLKRLLESRRKRSAQESRSRKQQC